MPYIILTINFDQFGILWAAITIMTIRLTTTTNHNVYTTALYLSSHIIVLLLTAINNFRLRLREFRGGIFIIAIIRSL